MPYKVKGLGAFGLSVDWDKVDGDKDVARRVMTFLEDRRILFGKRHREDEMHCVRSALEIRSALTDEIPNCGRSLAQSLRAMRGACRSFVESAGPNAQNFRRRDRFNTDPFSVALGELRTVFGIHITILAGAYGLDVEQELRSIMPPLMDDDGAPLDWMPGF